MKIKLLLLCCVGVMASLFASANNEPGNGDGKIGKNDIVGGGL
jgi:hypothetical protein